MDVSPTVPESVRIVTFDVETFSIVKLQDRNRVIAAFDQQVDSLRPEKRGIKSIEKDGPPASLRMSDFSYEDRLRRGLAPAIKLEIAIPESMNNSLTKRFCSPG